MSETASPGASNPGASLEDRYGTGRRRRLDRRFAWIAGGVILVAGISFMLWNNWQNTNRVEVVPISSGPMSDFEFEAKFSVIAPQHSLVACAVEALSPSKATVGWKIVELPFDEKRTQTVTARLYTTTPGTAAQAKACWVVER